MRYLLPICLLLTTAAWAESKRIEVYPLSQSYWDIQAGDTLDGIVDALLPSNHYLQDHLAREIIALNPTVFPDSDPDHMLANKRLWLPNGVAQPPKNADMSGYSIKRFQWGNIKSRD